MRTRVSPNIRLIIYIFTLLKFAIFTVNVKSDSAYSDEFVANYLYKCAN